MVFNVKFFSAKNTPRVILKRIIQTNTYFLLRLQRIFSLCRKESLPPPPPPPHRPLFAHPRVKSYVNNWLQMHSLEFVRKNENKTKFNQRDQYKNCSTVFFFWWNVTGSVHLTKSHFYLINLGRWQNIQTPLYGHPLNTDTSFWLRTVSFVPDYSLNHVNIFYKFNPLTNTHPCRQLWNALFVTFALWLIWRLLWKKDGIFAIIHFGQVLLNIHFSAALKALVYTW